MKTVIISVSPKRRFSNSSYFASLLSFFSGANVHIRFRGAKDYDRILDELQEADTLVLALPVYVDAVPSHVLPLLELLEQNAQTSGHVYRVYGIANCGFYEGDQCELELEMLKCWSDRSGLVWCGGMGIGAGEMIGFIRVMPPITLLIALIQFIISCVSQLHAGSFLLAAALSSVSIISIAVNIGLFAAFSFGAWLGLIRLAGAVRRGHLHKLHFTTVTFCPVFLFVFFANIFWCIRATLNRLPVWKMFRQI